MMMKNLVVRVGEGGDRAVSHVVLVVDGSEDGLAEIHEDFVEIHVDRVVVRVVL